MQTTRTEPVDRGVPYDSIAFGLGILGLFSTVVGCLAGMGLAAVPFGILGLVAGWIGFERVRRGEGGSVDMLVASLVLNTVTLAINLVVAAAAGFFVLGYFALIVAAVVWA